VLSLGDEGVHMREERWSPELRRSRLFVAGPSINPASAEAARREVERLVQMEVDWVKMHVVAGGRGARYADVLPLAMENQRVLHEAGIGIALGTDSGPTGRFQGYFEHLEMEMMVEGGLSPTDVLIASTGAAARCIGLEGVVGTVSEGAWADFVVLDADPLADIRNTRTIQSVWIAGNQVR
jgi:imidazolonepropionase-like amidohydrolase